MIPGDFFKAIFSILRWKVAGFISSPEQHYVEMAKSIINTLRESGVAVRSREQLPGNSTYKQKRAFLRLVKKEARGMPAYVSSLFKACVKPECSSRKVKMIHQNKKKG